MNTTTKSGKLEVFQVSADGAPELGGIWHYQPVGYEGGEGLFSGPYTTKLDALRAAEEYDELLAESDIEVGDRVCAGAPGTDAYDEGRVQSISDDMATVGWDTGVSTAIELSRLSLTEEG